MTRRGKKKVVLRCVKKSTPKPAIPTPAPANPGPVVKQPSITTLNAAYQELPPEKLGTGNWRVGRLTLSGSVSPFGVPTFFCAGSPACIEPPGSLAAGPLAVPIEAQFAGFNFLTPTWKLLVPRAIGPPASLTQAEVAAGTAFFEAAGVPDPATFLPSTATAAFKVAAPHVPLKVGNQGTEGETGTTFEPFSTFGSYRKIGGKATALRVEWVQELTTQSSSDCVFQMRVSGIPAVGDNGHPAGPHENSATGSTLFKGLGEGAKQIEVWAKRESAPGPCGLSPTNTGYTVDEVAEG